MNKKFTTFLMSMLTFIGFVSASAQSNNPILVDTDRHVSTVSTTDGMLKASLKKGANPGFYQIAYEPVSVSNPSVQPISTYNWVLGVDETTGELKWVNVSNPSLVDPTEYASTFWCVTVTAEDQSQQPKYDYINRLTGNSLSISMLDHKFTGAPTGGYTGVSQITEYQTSQVIETGGSTLTVELGGDIYGWSLSAQYNNLITGNGRMYSTYKPNYVVGFAVDEVGGTPQNIYLRTLQFNQADDSDSGLAADPANQRRFAKFRLRTAGIIELNANQINTLLNQQEPDAGVKLVFNPDVVVNPKEPDMDFTNPFTENYFIAEDSPINLSDLRTYGLYTNSTANLVNIRLKDSQRTYLRVDTAYHNTTGLKFLKFTWYDLTKDEKYIPKTNVNNPENLLVDATANSLIGQYNFLFTYDISEDKLYIQAAQVFDKSDDRKYFKDAIAYGITGTPATTTTTGSYCYTYPYVHIQDLSEGSVLSVFHTSQLPDISFGFQNCVPVSSDKTSIPNGVYLIQDVETGKYFAAPLYGDGKLAIWLEVNEGDEDDQEPSHMPAYQWVVLKDRDYEGVDTVSTITMYNREYAYNRNGDDALIYGSRLQLYKYNKGADKYVVSSSSWLPRGYNLTGNNKVEGEFGGKKVRFIPVSDDIISDPYLGYRKFDNDSLLVNKYVFNYFNPFTMNTYLTKGSGSKDSLLYVRENATQFNLRPMTYDRTISGTDTTFTYEFPYGFNVIDNEGSVKTKIPKLAQLKRTPYAIYLQGESYGETSESRYSMGDHSDDTYYYNTNRGGRPIADATYVYLKENNHYKGNHYYSLIELDYTTINYVTGTNTVQWNNKGTNTQNNVWGQVGKKKGGIADGDIRAIMRVEDITETRTSTFRVSNDESPLYRRFNSADENVNTDTTVVLRFVEGYRHDEYLQIENNPSFTKEGIDYLGIWREDKAASGISFYVDTAWVNRGAGYIKPQYLILIERETYAGSEAVPCEYEHNHGYAIDGTPLDAYTCPHAIPAIPGYTRAKYLVNFGGFTSSKLAADPRNKDAKVLPVESDTDTEFDNTYRWRGYDRAGFLQGIHIHGTDTLIILNEKYSKYDSKNALDKLNIDSIKVDKKNAVFDLTGDHHKYVTWSMRYLEPEKAFVTEEEGKNKTFLIESMKRLATTSNPYIEPDIAPEMAQWIKVQNECLVLTNPENSFFDQMRESSSSTGGDDAIIFDVEVGSTDKIAKDNDDVTSTNVVVIGGNGSVTVKNAANKAVVITNVLGQTIANTVVSSDNATISVPQGIVVVSVEGESAVKAIVK